MKYRSKLYNKFAAIKLQFFAGIELGVPSKDCRNFGICRITPVGELESPADRLGKRCGCNQCKGVITVLENNDVEISFLRKTITASDYNKYFVSGYFLVDEDHSFPGENGEPDQIQIQKGKYPVSIDTSLIKIAFRN